MDYLPIFMNLRDRHVVVVGGGAIAARKAELIAKSGAIVTIVSIELSDAMRRCVQMYGFAWREKPYEDSDIESAHLVVAATNKTPVNEAVHRAAVARCIPVNVVDAPALCTFFMPAIVDRSPIIIAISSGGRSPVLLRRVRTQLERLLPEGLGRLAAFLAQFRTRVAEHLPDFAQRRRYWEDVLDSSVPDLVYSGRHRQARQQLLSRLREPGRDSAPRGAVYLIGAGPGDPELMTIKGQRLLQRADVVVYDRLVPVGVLEMCRREAEMMYVGKRNGDHPVPQEQISALLVRLAGEGKRVARLKGGDPFVFGRGGEELAELVAANIEFEVVPGISAANGAASYAGIPLTHRDHAQSVSFWTGHMRGDDLDLDWRAMATGSQTLVFFMGRPNAGKISRRLIEHGLPPATPVAIVSAATTTRQVTVRTSLRAMPAAVAATDPELPVLIIVGTVVNLREDLAWFADGIDETSPAFPRHLRTPGRGDQRGVA